MHPLYSVLPYFFRWVEDKQVADRLVLLWPNIIQMMKFWECKPKSKRPTSKSYLNLKNVYTDSLYPVKLQFFSFFASILQPFLSQYQTDNPMIPFMYNDLMVLVTNILQLILKPEIISKCKSLHDMKCLDLKDKNNLLRGREINVGFSAEAIINDLKRKDAVQNSEVTSFRNMAYHLISATVGKCFERFPISSVIVRNTAVFDPRSMCKETPQSLHSKLTALLCRLNNLKVLPEADSDTILSQYNNLLQNEFVFKNEMFKNFDRKKTRLDEFFFTSIGVEEYKELSFLLKVVFTLSHGQVSVERGFSINKSILDVNMKSDSIVARKVIRDHMLANGLTPETINISNAMLKSFKSAHLKYTTHLEQIAVEKSKTQMSKQKSIITTEINDLKSKCKSLEETGKFLDNEFVDAVREAGVKNDLKYVTKANLLKRKSEGISDEIAMLKKIYEVS